MTVWNKQVAFDVTPEWWARTPATARQLIVAAAGVLVPQRLDMAISIFAVGTSVFAYDIPVPEDVPRPDLDALRLRIVDELCAARALLPFATPDLPESMETPAWFLADENGAA